MLDEAFWIAMVLLYVFALAGGTLALLSAIGSWRLRRRRRDELRQRRTLEAIRAWRESRRGFSPRQPGRGPMR